LTDHQAVADFVLPAWKSECERRRHRWRSWCRVGVVCWSYWRSVGWCSVAVARIDSWRWLWVGVVLVWWVGPVKTIHAITHG
jgi:hypothetical protein